MTPTVHTAPPDSGTPVLGLTLPDLLRHGADRHPNATAFNQWTPRGWQPWSNADLLRASEEIALGWQALSLDPGDHVAFYMDSDVYFVQCDFGCLIAGLVDVPLYLTNADEVNAFILDHAEAVALVVSDIDLFREIAPLAAEQSRLRAIVIVDAQEDDLPKLRPMIGSEQLLFTLDEVRQLGRIRFQEAPTALDEMKARVQPSDLATLIYTSGTTGRPKGVMLSHENLSFNALTAYSGIPMGRGPEETVLSFLPMTHVFARALNYGAVHYGLSIYYTHPDDVSEHFRDVRPTIFATVPRVLEKVYSKIMLKRLELDGPKRWLFDWALRMARRYELGTEPTGVYRWKLALADRLVLSKWREALGGQVRFVIAGGAALSAELTNLFAAAGVPIIQGYGLTETSPVITYNRPERNRAGTVGVPMAGVEVALADDGEILTRGPHVMLGYYRNPEATVEVIDEDGWLHTGDIGEMTAEGFLKITDRKKALFKLSTGKYVVPQPIENALLNDPLIEQAVVVGMGHKFCTALLFVNASVLRAYLREHGASNPDAPIEDLVHDPDVRRIYQNRIDRANAGRSHWETVKRFVLLPEPLTVESGLLTPSLKVKRSAVADAFREEIESMYADADSEPVRV